ncbi:hypothetical protein BCI9360_00629 [Bacillus sp. CECT 9360]|nr:hypothetical protein BCI9360_00629 [Bacillus sp. CECT 9360]
MKYASSRVKEGKHIFFDPSIFLSNDMGQTSRKERIYDNLDLGGFGWNNRERHHGC